MDGLQGGRINEFRVALNTALPMNLERIRQRLTRGFRPFSLRTSDDREYDVRHPESVLIGRHTMAVLDADKEIATLDPLHVIALKDLRPKKNGASKG
jgi:hypothetical protein